MDDFPFKPGDLIVYNSKWLWFWADDSYTYFAGRPYSKNNDLIVVLSIELEPGLMWDSTCHKITALLQDGKVRFSSEPSFAWSNCWKLFCRPEEIDE